MKIRCSIGNSNNELQFSLFDITCPEKAQILLEVTNFQNPWSAITVSSIRLYAFGQDTCFGTDKIGSDPISAHKFYPKTMPESNIEISSSSNVLGYSKLDNAVTFKFTPFYSTSPTKNGRIVIDFPLWFDVADDLNMMFNEFAKDTCTSPDFNVRSSDANIVAKQLTIDYDSMADNKVKGEVITITCTGFKNPISQGLWPGFKISLLDNEQESRNLIEESDVFSFNTNLQPFTPATIRKTDLTVAPSVFQIAEYSTWLVALTDFPIPLEKQCWIKLTIPPDLPYKNEQFRGQEMFDSVGQPSIDDSQKDTVGVVIKFEGCSSDTSVGALPQGILLIDSIRTPQQRRDSGTFKIAIYSNDQYEDKSLIAKIDNGLFIPTSDLQPNVIEFISIVPTNSNNQVVTTLTITIKMLRPIYDRPNIELKFPASITLPATGQSVIVSGTAIQYESASSTPIPLIATRGTVLQNNVIKIDKVFGDIDPPEGVLQLAIVIEGIKNPLSVRQAGDFDVKTYTEGFLPDMVGRSDGSYVSKTGEIGGQIVVTDSITSGTRSEYQLRINPDSMIPKNGFIEIQIPQRVILRPLELMSKGVCTSTVFTCLSVDNNVFMIKTKQDVPAKTDTTIVIEGITNPRNNQPTGNFHIITYDVDGVKKIDEGFDKDTMMEIQAPIDSFYVVPSSDVNHVINTYTFIISTSATVIDGDQLIFNLPPQVTISEPTTVTPIPRMINNIQVSDVLELKITGQQITVTFITVAPTLGEAYKFTIDKIQNPLSEKPSDPFSEIRFVDSIGFGVQEYKLAPVVIENKVPAEMTIYEFRQNDYVDLAVTTYWIHLTPVNPIPSTGSILIHWPKNVQVPDTVKCIVRTNFNWEDRCVIDQGTRAIKITNFFSDSATWSSNVIVTLEGVINPRDNKLEGLGFLIYTYIDTNQQYRIDFLPSDKLVPKLECDFPCRTCPASDRTYCNSCWTDYWSELKYHILIDGINDSRGHCGTQCPLGYGRDNDDSHICIPCGETCDVCKDEDKDHCLECSDLFPYSLSGTGVCLKSCSRGYFLTTTPNSCATCDLPCADCYGNAKYCIDCDRNSNFPVLLNNKCVPECPPGFFDDGKECQPCNSPCVTCVGNADYCLDCDGTLGRRYFFQNKCYETCPVNAAPDQQDEENLFCVGCVDPKCEICNNEDPYKCDRCFLPYYVQDDYCVELCSTGLHINADKTACVVWTIYDLGIIPFPWLSLTFIACFIILLGKCRKTRGRTKLISTQNTITCFIVIIAFFQFWAIISLGVWALLYYSTPFMFFASCGLLGAMIILNITFYTFYKCNFDRLITPDDKHKKYKKGMLSKAELKTYIHPVDEEFHKYDKKHCCISCCVCCSSCLCTFKCNKNYYSRCYSFDCFKARWFHGKYYRKSMTIFCIVSMVIDALTFCVCVAGLLTMTPLTTMLWVTTVEVAVLSLLLIIFGCIELCQLKEILRYNEKEQKATWGVSNKQKQIQVSSAILYFTEKDSGRDYSSQREFLPKHVLLMNKEKSQDMFLDKKLDNLLNLFGDRRCKSMTELCTGWHKEDDLHQVNSWPLSPKKIKEYDGVYTFTYADRMGSCFDNVYAQEKLETKVDEKAIQGDQDQQDFTRLFFQKQGNLIAGKIDEEDEMNQRSGYKRKREKSRGRGRINKYNAAIDAEDGDQVDAIDQFQQELDEEERQKLHQILKEQEEEEAMMRQKVEDDRKRQEEVKAERRAKLAETERLLREAEAAEAESRRQADEKEQFLQQLQQQQELELQRQNDILRARLAKEEEEARRKVEEEEEARAKSLSEKNEANRIQYEKEEAARKQKLEEEKARMKKLREENDSKMLIEQAELNRRRLEEADQLQAQKDEEELRLRQQQYKSEDEQRQKDKEQKRIRKEQSDQERRSIEKMNFELKRASRLEEEKMQHEAYMLERQKKLDQEMEERNQSIRMQDEKRQKLIEGDMTRNQKLEYQAQLKRDMLYKEDAERKVLEEQERILRLELEAEEKKARIQRYDAESLAAINKKEAQKKAEKEAKQRRKEAEQKRKKLQDEADRIKEREMKLEKEKEKMRDKEVKDLQARQDQVKARLREIQQKEEDKSLENLNEQDKEDLQQEKMRLIDTRLELEHQEGQLRREHEEHELRQRQREMKEAKQKALQDELFEKEMQEVERKIREGVEDPGDDVMMSLEPLADAFGKKGHPVEMPPNADNRTFNVNDILGELDRDDRGQVIILRDSIGNKVDKTGHAINEKGYMINFDTGDIIENYTGKKLFNAAKLDQKGEIPQPFCLEKFNFNPHDLIGDLDYQFDQSTGRAILKLNETKQGFYIDKKKRRVNRFGWLIDGNSGHIIDRNGRKKFDKKQLDDGDVQKLYNYNGKRFNIKDVIGAFEKNAKGDIVLNRAGLKSKVLTDAVGRKINHKGYLIDDNGNIIDRVGKLIFHKQHLKKGEFPKIFFFSKFNIESIKGDCEMSPLGEPILDTNPAGKLVDLKGRFVNSLGYLVDHDGNVIDKRGNLVFDKPTLGLDDDIPRVFKMQVLQTDSCSSLSRIGMDATDYNQQSAQFRPYLEESGRERWINERTEHSAMGESPVNYNFPVQPFEQQLQEDNESLVVESRSSARGHGQNGRPTKQSNYDVQADVDYDAYPRRQRGKKKKKSKDGYIDYIMPTEQQIDMADAYGGQAKGFFRQPGVIYNKNVLKNRIRTPANIPGGRTKLKALADIVSGFQQAHAVTQQSMFDETSLNSGRANRKNKAKRDQVVSGSQDGFSSIGSNGKISLGAAGRKHQAARTQMRTQQKPRNANQIQDDRDFEKMFGDDIDKYLEGDSDLEEYDKLSHLSRGTDNQKANIRQMEDIYLRRVGSDAIHNTSSKVQKQSTQARTPASSTAYSAMQSRKKKKSVKKQPTFRD